VRLKAILLIPRVNGFFDLKNVVVYRSYGFKGFPVDKVKAYYREKNQCDAYAVALVLQNSPVDTDFQLNTFFLAEDSVEKIREAFDQSDRLTEQLLKRPWGGVRPFAMVHHFC
jgi:hypothetical protein